MTNKEYYGDGSRAQSEYDKLGNVSFVDWLNRPCLKPAATLPSWVKVGAVYWHFENSARKYTVTNIRWADEKVDCSAPNGESTWTSFESLLNPEVTQHEPEFQIPSWMKVGARYFYPDTQHRVYTIAKVNILTGMITTTDGASNPASKLLANGVVEYKGWPSWLKFGDDVLCGDNPKPQHIAHVDDLSLITDTREEIQYTPNLKLTRVPKIPEWMKPDVKFEWNGSMYKISRLVLDHDKQHVKVQFNGTGQESFFDYDYIERYTAEFTKVEEYKLPAWVKVGAWVSTTGGFAKPKKIASIDDTKIKYTSGGYDWVVGFTPSYHEVVVTPWTPEQALKFLESKEQLIVTNEVRTTIARVEVYLDKTVLIRMCSEGTFSAQLCAERFETERHQPCGTWKIKG